MSGNERVRQAGVVTIDPIRERVVRVEVGSGGEGQTYVDRQTDIRDIEEGSILLVTVEPAIENAKQLRHGAVAKMTVQQFAGSYFLDGQVSQIVIFNVFGHAGASIARSYDESLMKGLYRKLKPGGEIVIGEHISPENAQYIQGYTRRLQTLGFQVENWTSPIAIDVQLQKRGFEERYRKAFIGQSEERKQWKGKEHGGFLTILRKKDLDSSDGGV